MRKPFKRIVSLFLAVVTAAAAMTVNASALTFCMGGRCFGITLPTGRYLTFAVPVKQQSSDGQCNDTQSCAKEVCGTPSVIPAGGDAAASTEASEVLAIVNNERTANGLKALTMTAELNRLAEIRAQEIVRTFSHTRPDGRSCFTVFGDNGVTYRNAGENIAYGQTSAAAVMNAWLNSSGHRANILSKNFGKIGIACYIANGRKYWVQLFTN